MLVRYNPWQEFNSLQGRMNRLFDEALSPLTELERGNVRVPAAELHETADAIHLKLEVPGIEALIFGCASNRECCFHDLAIASLKLRLKIKV